MNKAVAACVFLVSLLSSDIVLTQGQQGYDRAVPLDKALEEIGRKYDVHFAYDPSLCARYVVEQDFFTDKWVNQIEEALFQTPLRLVKHSDRHYLIVPDRHKEFQISSRGYHEEPISVRGRVLDLYQGEALAGVSVVLLPDGAATDTDEDGYFFLKAKTQYARPKVHFRYLGYENKAIELAAPCDTQIEIRLLPHMQFIETVVVSDIQAEPALSKKLDPNIQLASLQFSSALFRDPLRRIQQLSGINAANDLSSQIQIRGSQADENSIRLDELNLYSVDHFYGLFSNINPFLIQEISIFKSYFPANYGGKTSSLILLKTPSATTKPKGVGELSFLNSSGFLQIPIFDGADILISGRISNRNIGQGSFFEDLFTPIDTQSRILRLKTENVPIQPEFNFYDYYSKLRMPLYRKFYFFATLFGSKDETQTLYQARSQLNQAAFNESYRDSAEWRNFNFQLGVGYEISPSSKWLAHYGRTVLSSKQGVEVALTEARPRQSIIETNLYDLQNEMSLHNVLLEYKTTRSRHTHSIGIEGNISSTHSIYKGNRTFVFRDSSRHQSEWSFYHHHKMRLNNRWTLDAGLRFSKYKPRDNIDFSPRINLQYHWKKNMTSQLRAGIYYQYLRQYEIEDRFGRRFNYWTNANEQSIPSIKSFQTEFVQKIALGKYQVAVEAFYKKVNGALEQVDDRGRRAANATIGILGEARLKGFELSLERQWAVVSVEGSYSYLDAKNAFPLLFDGKYYPVPFTSAHQIKLNSTLDYKKFLFQCQGVYGSPQSYTATQIIRRPDAGINPIISRKSVTLNYFMRWDTRVAYLLKLGKVGMEISAAVYNVLDRENVKYNQILYNIPGRNTNEIVTAEVRLLPRTYDMALRIMF